MRAESTIKPALFEVKISGEYADIKFYNNIKEKELVSEENTEKIWEYDEYLLTNIRNRQNLEEKIKLNYDEWLKLAISESTNVEREETEREKIIRLQQENRQLGIEISNMDINNIIQVQQISEIEIQMFEMKPEVM